MTVIPIDAEIAEADWLRANDIPTPGPPTLDDMLADLERDRQPDARHYPGKHDQKMHGSWAKGGAGGAVDDDGTPKPGAISPALAQAGHEQVANTGGSEQLLERFDSAAAWRQLQDEMTDEQAADYFKAVMQSRSIHSDGMRLWVMREIAAMDELKIPHPSDAEFFRDLMNRSPLYAKAFFIDVASRALPDLYARYTQQHGTFRERRFDAGQQKAANMQAIGAQMRASGLPLASNGEALATIHGTALHRSDDPYERAAAYLVDQWAESSADHRETSINLQRATAEVLKVDNAWDVTSRVSTYRGAGGAEEFQKRLDADWESNQAVYKAFVKATYDHTQATLKQAGITELVLYRGVRNSDLAIGEHYSPEPYRVQLQPISSFSTSLDVAKRFASASRLGAVMATSVPAERVYSLYTTSIGCLPEREVVVIGGEMDVWATSRTKTFDTFSAEARHYPGKHDQQSHGNWAKGSAAQPPSATQTSRQLGYIAANATNAEYDQAQAEVRAWFDEHFGFDLDDSLAGWVDTYDNGRTAASIWRDSFQMMRYLRGQDVDDDFLRDEGYDIDFDDATDVFDTVISDHALPEGGLTMYRGAAAAHLGDLRAGTVIEDDSFLSFSPTPELASKFVEMRSRDGKQGALIRLRGQEGDPVIPIDPEEILIDRGSRLRVVNVSYDEQDDPILRTWLTFGDGRPTVPIVDVEFDYDSE